MKSPKPSIRIGERLVGPNRPTYVIAEIGSNHNQDLSRALDMIEQAAAAGADAVKFQSLRFDRLYSARYETEEFASWFRQIELDEAWYMPLSQTARRHGVDFLSSPTYPEALDLLDEVGVPAYKIASPQAWGDLDLLRAAAARGKPLLISTGYCSLSDIETVTAICREADNTQFALLHCVSKYPLAPIDANLGAIPEITRRWSVVGGYSDHSLGITLAVAAVSLGASIVEKHVTVDRSLVGPDHHFALTFEEFKSMVTAVREVEASFGLPQWENRSETVSLRQAVERKAFASSPIKQGMIVGGAHLEFKRCSQAGIRASESSSLIGRVASRDLEQGALLRWEDFGRD